MVRHGKSALAIRRIGLALRRYQGSGLSNRMLGASALREDGHISRVEMFASKSYFPHESHRLLYKYTAISIDSVLYQASSAQKLGLTEAARVWDTPRVILILV